MFQNTQKIKVKLWKAIRLQKLNGFFYYEHSKQQKQTNVFEQIFVLCIDIRKSVRYNTNIEQLFGINVRFRWYI